MTFVDALVIVVAAIVALAAPSLIFLGNLALKRMLARPAVRAWLHDFAEGYDYVRDPTGWGIRIRRAEIAKWEPRPAMYMVNDAMVVAHPALAKLVQDAIGPPYAPSPYGADTIKVLVTLDAVQDPPPNGWPDIVVPELPRMRP